MVSYVGTVSKRAVVFLIASMDFGKDVPIVEPIQIIWVIAKLEMTYQNLRDGSVYAAVFTIVIGTVMIMRRAESLRQSTLTK
jgi:hypothetical protein